MPGRVWGTLHGLGDEGRASPRETLAGAARGRGKGPATECLAFTIHGSPKTLIDPHMCPSRRPLGPSRIHASAPSQGAPGSQAPG
ncbi:hypothetical protein TCARB_1813 [Thermofilum adornatum 1505]|uniref:Uncharacterized protein n=1 Tax=Thermofilum adornatum 1505 TaxID=697581 RepID=A0A3G1A7A7_9CREN|nr:hypothetical protein [Thermofilum adornatum]AJB42849.1 hypothetical protein TCARB_1813 [Thermofilum adornatum 1505]